METTSNVCNLIFRTSLDRKRVVRIPDPASHLNMNMVNIAADAFIHANPFDETVGSLLSLANAERVITTTIALIA